MSALQNGVDGEVPHYGPMFAEQKSLPHLPVPPLQQTLDKFLISVKPILSTEEFTTAQEIVTEFGKPGGDGEKLQELLEQRAEKEINWLREWWLNREYLERRCPTAIHVNPGFLLPNEDFSGQEAQLRYAALLVSGILNYKVMIDEQTLPVERQGKTPLCMMQYYEILSTCRIPHVTRDIIVNYPPDKPDPPHYIVVIHNNQFFAVNTYGSCGKPLNVDQLYKQLCYVVEESQTPGKAIGVLTSDYRNTWAEVYSELMENETNKTSLEKIQKSIFILCLDQPNPHAKLDNQSEVASQMNHGGGSRQNSGNRWFDKTLQFIVGFDGEVGVNYEHAPAEGPPIVSLIDHAMSYVRQGEKEHIPVEKWENPQRLEFVISESVDKAIQKATIYLDKTITDLNMKALKFDLFGKNFIKAEKLSPDAFIQVSIQLAYYRMYNTSCATYESCSLRRYQYGRTETIRSCTSASTEYAKGMDDKTVLESDKADLLRKAIAAHRKYTSDAAMGQGIDRHLLGLKQIATENNFKTQEFLEHPVYTKSVHWKLSTSQVPSREHALLLFAPVVPDGYGVSYNPHDDDIYVAVSSWNSVPETDAPRLAQEICNALQDNQYLLLCDGVEDTHI